MKKVFQIFLSVVLSISANSLIAQNDNSGIVELDNSTEVLVLPRLSLSDIIDMENPPEGAMVYNLTKKQVNVFNGTLWLDMLGREMLRVGDVYGGGIVFYLDGKGGGLVCAPMDQGSNVQWYNGDNIVTGATSMGRDTGQANTTMIIDAQGSGKYAASICDKLKIDKYSDWYLPNKDELNLMYQNIGVGNALGLGNIGGFARSFYWSSSEFDQSSSWIQDFGNGNQFQMTKNYLDFIRAIRAF